MYKFFDLFKVKILLTFSSESKITANVLMYERKMFYTQSFGNEKMFYFKVISCKW